METRGRPVAPGGGTEHRRDFGREFEERIGPQVKKLRKERGWTGGKLAERWGQTAADVSRLEKGTGARAALDTLASLAEALNDPPDHPMSLGDLLWEVIEPEAAAELEAVARARFSRELFVAYSELRKRYLDGLEKKEALQIFEAVSVVAASDKEELNFLVRLVLAARIVFGIGRIDDGSAWAEPMNLTPFATDASEWE